MITRRDFLKTGSTLIALAPTVPGFLAQTARAARPAKDGRILVVVQLDGGNDGINTVVPFKDEGYAKHRRLLRLPPAQLVKVSAEVGLHPALADAGRLLDAGRLTVVQGVGYPNPNRSHFESMAVWQTARLDADQRDGRGWLGRALDGARQPAGGVPASVFVGVGPFPVALRGRRSLASGLTRPEDFLLAPEANPKPATLDPGPASDLAAFVQRAALDAYATAGRMAEIARAKDAPSRYPATRLAERLQLVARLIKADVGTRVFYVSQSGYDTHAGQEATHRALLGELAGGLKAFLDDLAAAGLADRVAVLSFSEFGRTVRENSSGGTDHGTAGPVFLAGPQLPQAVVGQTPSLVELDRKHGDLKVGSDFRRVYATMLEDWLGLSAEPVLGAAFERLPLFRV
jgi:uncharacterized protein (DUF1501 family)